MMIGLLIKEGYSLFTINFRDKKYSQPLIDFNDNEENREKIVSLLLKRQEEVLYHYLNNEERKKYKINPKKKIGDFRSFYLLGLKEYSEGSTQRLIDTFKSGQDITNNILIKNGILKQKKIKTKVKQDNFSSKRTEVIFFSIDNIDKI